MQFSLNFVIVSHALLHFTNLGQIDLQASKL